MRTGAVRRAGGVLGILVVLTGCTGVPSSSRPEVIASLGAVQPVVPAAVTPQPDAEPRTIIAGFLTNNATSDVHHLAARAFLTSEATNRWSDTTVTVVDNPQIGNPDKQNQVTVTGRIIGTINGSGIYTPSLQGDGRGGGGAPVSLTFGLKKDDGQWRIDTLQNGLFISDQQFQDFYQQRTVYFYDQAEEHLVPDPRFSALQDPTLLATWLMTQLAEGTRPELQAATNTELPAQTDPRRVTASLGPVIKIEIPGASQLALGTRDRLAAQVALTLEPVASGTPISITDGGRAVTIPRSGATFTASIFSDAVAPANQVPPLYYINDNGLVIGPDGKALPGPLGNGQYHLNAVALASMNNSATLLAAGTAGSADAQTLYVGTDGAPLRRTAVTGALSRPAWVPNMAEVWIGAGKTLYRVASNGAVSAVAITTTSGKLSGQIIAVRFSPEGARIAVVLQTADGAGQIWLGSVVRATNAVRVSNMQQISPQGVTITDVAWNDELKLFAVGRDIGGLPNVYELQSDGSLWTPRGIPNLPGPPDSITVAENVVASVSVGNTVWVQRGGSWVSPTGGSTHGTNPVYLE
ncbi:MAG: LpqB family beta-propeller domain-containing protein [Jatrophihabitantaceae bacterium]